MGTASELVAEVRDLVTLPDAYLKIQTLMRDPGSTLDAFARAIQTDPVLSARVLRVANSAFFGVSRRVETVSLAINLMGVQRLHDLVLSTVVIGTFSRVRSLGINMASYWRRSIHVGVLSRMLAEECGRFDSERLFVAGMLHDVGHLVMYMRIPEKAAAALARSRAESSALAAVEREDIGFHYGEVGAALMENWLFPDSLQEICQLHTNPARAQRYPRECSIVSIALQAVMSGDPEASTLPWVAPVAPITLQLADVGEATVARLLAESYEHLVEAVDMLLPAKAA